MNVIYLKTRQLNLMNYWFICGFLVRTRMTAFSTYLKLPRAVKMTVCLITTKCLIIRYYFVLQASFDCCVRPSDVLNYCKWDFNES